MGMHVPRTAGDDGYGMEEIEAAVHAALLECNDPRVTSNASNTSPGSAHMPVPTSLARRQAGADAFLAEELPSAPKAPLLRGHQQQQQRSGPVWLYAGAAAHGAGAASGEGPAREAEGSAGAEGEVSGGGGDGTRKPVSVHMLEGDYEEW